jgi:hypothetical protein
MTALGPKGRGCSALNESHANLGCDRFEEPRPEKHLEKKSRCRASRTACRPGAVVRRRPVVVCGLGDGSGREGAGGTLISEANQEIKTDARPSKREKKLEM